MKYTVEIPVKVSKSNGSGITRGTFLRVEVDEENETRAVQVVTGRIQRLLHEELAVD